MAADNGERQANDIAHTHTHTHTHIPPRRTVAQSLHSDSVRDGGVGGWGELGKAGEIDVNAEEGKKEEAVSEYGWGVFIYPYRYPPCPRLALFPTVSLSLSGRSPYLFLHLCMCIECFGLQCIHAGCTL